MKQDHGTTTYHLPPPYGSLGLGYVRLGEFHDDHFFDGKSQNTRGAHDRTPHTVRGDYDGELRNKPAHAVPLASARQRPENPKGKPGRPFAGGARGGGPAGVRDARSRSAVGAGTTGTPPPCSLKQFGGRVWRRIIAPVTPPAVGPCFRRHLISCRPKLRQNETWLPNHNPKPTPAWLGGAMRRRGATTTKKHAFL